MIQKILTVLIALSMLTMLISPVNGHPGRTDSDGGHYNHSTGEYHWHHGQPEHQHKDLDGDGIYEYCPYDYNWIWWLVGISATIIFFIFIFKKT